MFQKIVSKNHQCVQFFVLFMCHCPIFCLCKIFHQMILKQMINWILHGFVRNCKRQMQHHHWLAMKIFFLLVHLNHSGLSNFNCQSLAVGISFHWLIADWETPSSSANSVWLRTLVNNSCLVIPYYKPTYRCVALGKLLRKYFLKSLVLVISWLIIHSCPKQGVF